MVGAVYSGTIHFGFVNYDDGDFITGNPHVLNGLNLDNIRWAIVSGTEKSTGEADYWRPLSILSHMFDVQFFGLRAGYHHAVNVLLHALSSEILFLALRALTGTFWRSAAVAALFAVHPLHVESVAWVAERKDVLCGFFFMVSLLAYARYSAKPFSWVNYATVVLCYALALASKPIVVTLPVILLLLDYWPLKRLSLRKFSSWLTPLLEKLPLLTMSLVVSVLAYNGSGGVNVAMMHSLGLRWRLGNAVVAYTIYLREMVWPFGLTVFYPHPGQRIPLLWIGTSLLILLGITLVVILLRGRGYLRVGWFWYIGMLLPVIGIVQSGDQSHADRYTYLPLIGIFVALAWLLSDWVGKNARRRILLATLFPITLCWMIVVARIQTSVWTDSLTLWRHAIACDESNGYAHYNLANALDLGGRGEEAIPHYERALALLPGFAQAENNIGNILLKRREPEKAIPRLQAALAIRKTFPEAHYNLGCCFALEGRFPEAIDQLRLAVTEKPDYPEAHRILGNLLLTTGKASESLPHFRKVLELNPKDAQTRSNLGSALIQSGDDQAALLEFERAASISPDNIVFQNNLAWVLATSPRLSLRDGKRAVVLAERVVSQKGDNAQALCTLAAAFAESARFPEAMKTAAAAKTIAEAQGKKDLARIIEQEIEVYSQGKAIGK